jgi:hypothetical protein
LAVVLRIRASQQKNQGGGFISTNKEKTSKTVIRQRQHQQHQEEATKN